jgi:hypothetical protein
MVFDFKTGQATAEEVPPCVAASCSLKTSDTNDAIRDILPYT